MLKQQQVIFTKVSRQFNGKRVDFSTNGAQTTGYLDAKKKKKKNLTQIITSQHTKTLTQNRLETYM